MRKRWSTRHKTARGHLDAVIRVRSHGAPLWAMAEISAMASSDNPSARAWGTKTKASTSSWLSTRLPGGRAFRRLDEAASFVKPGGWGGDPGRLGRVADRVGRHL